MTFTGYIQKLLSNDGTASSSRAGFLFSLVIVAILIAADTIMNKRLDFGLTALFLTAGGGGYVVSKNLDKDKNSSEVSLQKATVEELEKETKKENT